MDYDSIAKAGSMLGSGAVIVMDETRCMVRVAASACRTSTTRSPAASARRAAKAPAGCTAWSTASSTGRARMRRPRLLLDVADNIEGRTICALGDAAAMPVQSFLKHFRDEFEYHIEHKRCLDGMRRAAGQQRRARERHGGDDHGDLNIEIDGKPVEVPQGSDGDACRAQASAPTCRTSAITRSSRSRPTAACAWSRSRRRRSRCRPAPRRSPRA